ncbi:MAG TPA: hypothetical protein VMW16_04890 [Sedimentisphaerales bacterium]|nr:hypothetical protein [Sedimentisphaerales bacterium]
MKLFGMAAQVFFSVLLLVGAGCELGPGGPSSGSDKGPDPLSVYASYSAAKVDIMPLTDFVGAGSGGEAGRIRVYVGLLDSFNSQIKSPGVFRFELYEHVQRSPEPAGKRLVVWPDIDLTDPAGNNNYWRDYLRAYEFSLDFEPQNSRSYLLQVTCLCPNGKRLSDAFVLKYGK